MRIGSENIGRNGATVLGVTLVLSTGVAIYGYGHGLSAGGPIGVNSSSPTPGAKTTSPSTTLATKAKTVGPVASQKLGPTLASTQYASLAYRLYPGPISTQAKQAMAGFSVKVKPGTIKETVILSMVGSSAAGQSASYLKGDKVYFIEASFGDDSGNSDYSGGDDGVVVTNLQGRIVQ